MAWKHYTKDGVLRIDFMGVVTSRDSEEIALAAPEIERGFSVVPHRISDLTGSTGLELTFSDLDRLAESRKAMRFSNAFKSAIVAPQPAQFGFARMFQVLNNHPQITIEIFPDLASAQAWIAKS